MMSRIVWCDGFMSVTTREEQLLEWRRVTSTLCFDCDRITSCVSFDEKVQSINQMSSRQSKVLLLLSSRRNWNTIAKTRSRLHYPSAEEQSIFSEPPEEHQ